MKHIYCLLLLCLLSSGTELLAQDTYVPYNQDVYHLIDRYQIKYGSQLPELHTSVRPIGRADAARLAEISARHAGSAADQFNTQYLLNDNWNYTDSADNISDRPVFNFFYKNKTDLYHFQNEDFTVRVNPVLHLEGGIDDQTDGIRYINTRGIQIEGSVDDRLGFYTFIAENQASYPAYVVDRIQRDGVIPHEGFWKRFKEDGYDYITARGYINYAISKHVEVQLGHDRHFIGDGYRSLVQSDYAPPAFFLKLNTRVWKLHYMNLFQELTAEYGRGRIEGDLLLPKKYMALHRLGINLTDNFNLGVFESVVFGREKGKFELQYLNPVIFYRSVEHALGSQDNALLGADFRWNIFNRGQLYGQLMLDEFLLSEVKGGNGWWANKVAGQLGAKYIDAFGAPNLDLQGEVNVIRPYTYQHRDQSTSYQHYRQPLAHPNGANLYEFIGIIRYQPIPRLNIKATAIATRFGQDIVTATDTVNYGNNVNLPYTKRPGDYGHEIGQGVATNQVHLDLTATFQLRHNLFVDLKQVIRRTDANNNFLDRNTAFTSFALRWNISQRIHDF